MKGGDNSVLKKVMVGATRQWEGFLQGKERISSFAEVKWGVIISLH